VSGSLGANGRRVSASLWLVLTLFIIYGSTLPFRFTSDHTFVLAKLRRLTLNPLISPDTGRRLSMPDVAQNVLLYAPVGVLGVLTVGTPRRSRTARILLVIVLAALLSSAMETVQLFTTDRTTSLADVLANTFGALSGALAAPVVIDAARRLMTRPEVTASLRTSTFYLFAMAMLVVCASAWAPFDVALDVSSVWTKLKALGSEPWSTTKADAQLVAYLLLTLPACSWFKQIGIRPAVPFAAAVGVVVALGLEATKLLIESRTPSIAEATMHAAGAVAGAIIAAIWSRARARSV